MVGLKRVYNENHFGVEEIFSKHLKKTLCFKKIHTNKKKSSLVCKKKNKIQVIYFVIFVFYLCNLLFNLSLFTRDLNYILYVQIRN